MTQLPLHMITTQCGCRSPDVYGMPCVPTRMSAPPIRSARTPRRMCNWRSQHLPRVATTSRDGGITLGRPPGKRCAARLCVLKPLLHGRPRHMIRRYALELHDTTWAFAPHHMTVCFGATRHHMGLCAASHIPTVCLGATLHHMGLCATSHTTVCLGAARHYIGPLRRLSRRHALGGASHWMCAAGPHAISNPVS